MAKRGLINKTLYILAADGGRAKFYKTETPFTSVNIINDLVNFNARKKAAELYSDRAGSQHGSGGGHHSYDGEHESHHEDEVFARNLCRILQTDHRAGKYDNLVLIAPPHFLGEIRRHLSKECANCLTGSIDKDLVQMSDEEVLAHVR